MRQYKMHFEIAFYNGHRGTTLWQLNKNKEKSHEAGLR